MKIIRPHDGQVAAERRLVAEMLNLEHGALAVDPDANPLPAPHAPYPMVDVPPVTEQGEGYQVHYRPAVGLVFYSHGQGFNAEQFARRLGAALQAHGSAHLRAHRPTGVTPAAAVLNRGRIGPREVAYAGLRKHYRKAENGQPILPARLVAWMLGDAALTAGMPPTTSLRAGFTWVFMPVSALLEAVEHACDHARPMLAPAMQLTPALVNALVASVYYDGVNLSRHADQDVIGLDGPVFPQDFLTPHPIPAEYSLAQIYGWSEEALLVDRATQALELVGDRNALVHRPTVLAALPVFQGDTADIFRVLAVEGALLLCLACLAPLGGRVLVLSELHAPPRAAHGGNRQEGPRPGAPYAAKHLAMCRHCWSRVTRPSCVTGESHMAGALSVATLPPQSETAAASLSFGAVSPLLQARAEPVLDAKGEHIPGAYVLHRQDTPPIVVAAPMYGRYPALACSEIAQLGLPVLDRVPLATLKM